MSTVGALLFGGSGLVGLVEMFRPPRELHIGPQGVYCSDWADEVIPWCEITRITARDRDQSRWFVLHLRDGSVFQNLYPEGRWRRLISRGNRVWFRGQLWISMVSYDRRYDEAYTAFEAFSPIGVVFEVPGRSSRH